MNTQKHCQSCGSSFIKSKFTSKKRWALQAYCSLKCSGEAWEGHAPPKSAFKKGFIPWNKGKKHSPETIKKLLVINKLNKKFGEEHHNWKGEKAKHAAIHIWVSAHKKKPKRCSDCKKVHRWIHWSNKDHKYRRNLDDYVARCPSCHKKYDLENGIANH